MTQNNPSREYTFNVPKSQLKNQDTTDQEWPLFRDWFMATVPNATKIPLSKSMMQAWLSTRTRGYPVYAWDAYLDEQGHALPAPIDDEDLLTISEEMLIESESAKISCAAHAGRTTGHTVYSEEYEGSLFCE